MASQFSFYWAQSDVKTTFLISVNKQSFAKNYQVQFDVINYYTQIKGMTVFGQVDLNRIMTVAVSFDQFIMFENSHLNKL